ncbi:capsid protein [Leuconostoc gelidum subsp. gasicomitatum]|uniref:capsid protein n=1 Tax=Leuconostoc gasicomitatum TaxID=115778 RepID=UPI001CC45A0C|nr:capsid protein [Leuconostoc gasicomitatum]MBZ5943914.1 capsid protein [Leuconostoc gasicomitatum]MBZ5973023.1 capsid protein [Leuconostoc gasicomitatum]
MDLLERLADKINQLENLPSRLIIGHLSNDNDFGIYSQPGSQVTSQDWSGIQERTIPIEIVFHTNDFELGNNLMWRVSELLDSTTSLETDGTYDFDKINVQPQPFPVTTEISQWGYFLLDFSVEITQQIKIGD